MTTRRVHQPVIFKPTFPHLDAKIAVIRKEIDYLNEIVIPYMREHGFSANSGRMNWENIKQAATTSEVCPEIQKRELRYSEYMVFKGYAVALNESAFMEQYNETQEGRERLEIIAACEQFPRSFPAAFSHDPRIKIDIKD